MLSGKHHAPILSGFDRIEAGMAFSYAQRSDGWPVGPEVTGRAWSCVTPTVQIIQQPRAKGPKQYVVLTLFPFRFTDCRYPPSVPLPLYRARRFAIARLSVLAGSGHVVFGRGPGIELARGGDHVGLEVPL